MCVGHNPRAIDKCLRYFITYLKMRNVPVVACCCGHNRYPMTIVVKWIGDYFMDVVSMTFIPRKKKFYKKDDEGYYYIPEVLQTYESKW